MKRLKVIVLLFPLFLLSCMEETDRREINAVLDIRATIHDTPIAKQVFANDDRIGVFLVRYNNNVPGLLGDVNLTTEVNVDYRYEPTGYWYPADGTDVFLDSGYSDLYAYFPYDEGMGREPGKINVTAYPFAVQTNQQAGNEESDFLWSKVSTLSETNVTAPIVFSHLMSRFEMNIRIAEGINLDGTPELQIYNTRTTSTINMRNGRVIPGDESNVITPLLNTNTTPGFDFTYEAIVIPQTLTAGTPLFTATLDGTTYMYELASDMTLISQQNYRFDLIAGPAASPTRLTTDE